MELMPLSLNSLIWIPLNESPYVRSFKLTTLLSKDIIWPKFSQQPRRATVRPSRGSIPANTSPERLN